MISEISEKELKHLQNYILSARKHKHPDSKIRETLLSQGWTDTALDQAFKHANKQTPAKKTIPTKQIHHLHIITIIIILALTSTIYALSVSATTVSDFQEAFENKQENLFYEQETEYAQQIQEIFSQAETITLLAKQPDDLNTLMEGKHIKTTTRNVPAVIQTSEYSTTYTNIEVTQEKKQTDTRVHYLHVQPKGFLHKDVALIIGQTLVLDNLSGEINFGMVKTFSGWKLESESMSFSVSEQGAVDIDTNGKSLVIYPTDNPLINLDNATTITIYDYDKQQVYCQEELEYVQTNTTTYLQAECNIPENPPHTFIFRYELEINTQTIDGLAVINT